MKCPSCSAPLPAGKALCRYCGTAVDVDFSGKHYYTDHQPDKPRPCPACALPMETINVATPEAPFFIERCPTCLGLFFDPGELQSLVDRDVQSIYSVDRLAMGILAGQNGETRVRYRRCPICATLMNRINFGQASGVIVDECRDHGVYLDAGELRRVVSWVQAGGRIIAAQRAAAQPAPSSSPMPAPGFFDFEENASPGFPRLAGFLLKLLGIRVR